jgi:hypothetical protein
MWLVVMLTAGALSLAGCATPTGIGTGEPSPSMSPTEPTPSATPTELATPPEPTPTESATVVTPYNGDVLVVTSEVIGGQLEVTAMIPGVSETGGTCVLEVTGSTETASVSGNAGNDVTYCGVMAVRIPSGTDPVQFHVSYSSGSTQAKSATSTVESAG